MQHLVFEAQGAGEATINLFYERPWEAASDPNRKPSAVIHVTTDAAKNVVELSFDSNPTLSVPPEEESWFELNAYSNQLTIELDENGPVTFPRKTMRSRL